MSCSPVSFVSAAVAAMLIAAAPAGCASGSSAESDGTVGTVSLPLVSQANGHTYRLRNLVIYVSGPQFVQLVDSGDLGQTALAATLTTGSYSAFLLPGWTLERDDGAGGFSQVLGTLVSSSSVSFTIFDGATSTLAYQFRTDGVIVTVGAGNLQVVLDVDEVGAACTPFGTDCGAGAWCPPTTLTGTARACIPQGATPTGAACGSPLECVANASCFDLGSGPICAALCPPSQFGGSCDGGGACQPAGAEYGVCWPAAAAP
jgi:hypothetical protein